MVFRLCTRQQHSRPGGDDGSVLVRASPATIVVGPALAADRVALVIGNGAYAKVPTLPNPPHDAADMARALERLGFQVTQLNDASADAMRKALVAFGQSTEGSSIAVVFYAGHGLEAG
jgi:hypothetical protein